MEGSDKLDARSKYELAKRGSDAPEDVSVLVRGKEPFSEAQLETLRDLGADIRTVAGDIVTATVSSDVVERMADEPFVVALEVSQPLYLEGPQAPFAADVE